MKIARYLSIARLLAAALITATATPLVAAEATGDKARIIETMRTLFVAATHDDLAKFHTVATRNFYAFDLGKRFEGDELMALIRKAHAAGKVYVWQVTNPEVRVDGHMGWITYLNRGSLSDASGTKQLSWLESAILHKEGAVWRIEFLHSTRVPAE